MKTISELRLEGDARVSIHDMIRFEAAILGGRGDLDAWLECNNEEEVRLHIGKLLHLCVADLQHENQSLRTKIEAMEQQVPYCWTTSPQSGHYSRFNPEVDRWIENGWTVVPLYLAPGAQAQNAPSAPETWLEQGLKELDAIRQNSNRDDWQPNDENIVRRLYQSMVAYGVQQAPSVPYGWKLVPIEPTEEMMMRDSSCQKHAHDDQSCVHRTNRRWIWKTMLEAAPEAKP